MSLSPPSCLPLLPLPAASSLLLFSSLSPSCPVLANCVFCWRETLVSKVNLSCALRIISRHFFEALGVVSSPLPRPLCLSKAPSLWSIRRSRQAPSCNFALKTLLPLPESEPWARCGQPRQPCSRQEAWRIKSLLNTSTGARGTPCPRLSPPPPTRTSWGSCQVLLPRWVPPVPPQFHGPRPGSPRSRKRALPSFS